MSTTNEILAGTVGGIAGGLAMAMAMVVAKATGMVPEPMPLKIDREVEQRVGLAQQTTPPEEIGLAGAEHMAVSAAFGAGYGLVHSQLHNAPIPAGPLYGLGVYTLNLAGILPALDLTPGPWNERPMTVGRRVMMHAVYGTVTGVVADRVLSKLEPEREQAGGSPQ